MQFSVEGRDLAGAVEDAMQQVRSQVALPQGYRLDWGGEYAEYTASRAELNIILPLTLFIIFLLLFALYSNFKFPFITVLGVVLSAPVGGILALWLTARRSRSPRESASWHCSASRCRPRWSISPTSTSCAATVPTSPTPSAKAAILRLRPIMMTALVAALGLLPVALATGVGTDSQRPFALVIVSGLFSRLLISVYLMPALYTLVARPGDRLEV